MDGAPPLSAQIAEAKASGAALWLRDGGGLAQVAQDRPAFFEAVGRMTRLPIIPGAGSVVARPGPGALGAGGVRGGEPEQGLDFGADGPGGRCGSLTARR